jgi:hypothetical protein
VWVGIDRRHQLVRLDAIADGDAGPGLRLCDRHAARLTLPLGWHLDDRRSGTMTLWTSADGERRPAAAATGQPAGGGPVEPVAAPAPKQAKRPPRKGGGRVTPPKRPQAGLLPAAPPPSPAGPADDRWRPVFDRRDDLDGLLAAESPLLSRAFGRRAG